MPKIKRVRIHNFRGASTPFELAFPADKHIVLVFGENGTGKTTIVDALDAVGNQSGGSVDLKSSTTLRTHLPTIGKRPADMTIEVASDTTTWTAMLGRNGVSATPSPLPPIRVLRRVNLQRFIDSPPRDRYSELRNLIGVERIEQSEDGLRRAVDETKSAFDQAVRARVEAEDQLEAIWKREARPGSSWEAWTATVVSTDPAQLQSQVQRSRATRGAIENARRARAEWQDVASRLRDCRQAAEQIEREIAESPALDSHAAVRLIELLGSVQEHLEHGGDGDQCPVCLTPLPLTTLRATVTGRLAELERFQTLVEHRRTAQNRLRTAEQNATAGAARLTEAAVTLWRLATATPDGYARIPLPNRVEQPIADDVPRAEALIAVCEPLSASMQVEEDRAVGTISQNSTIRELHARLAANRAKTVELERLVGGLTKAHEIVRATRQEFTQTILDDVASECNRLYETIHPGEGLASAKIALDPKQRASIQQSMSFGGQTDVVPQAYLSEAHLDTFGFCFWLAFAKREHPKGDAVLVFDDVFSSVDAPHMSRIIDVIVEESKNFEQVVITTHQRTWRDAFGSSHRAGNSASVIELQPWSLAQGMYSYQAAPALDELKQILATVPFNRQAVASNAGILLEATLDRLSFQYKTMVVRKRDNAYTLGELLDATAKLFAKLSLSRPVRDAAGRLVNPADRQFVAMKQLHDDLRQFAHVRNQVGAHHNLDGMEVSDRDVRAFGDIAVRFVEALRCPDCGQVPSKSTGTGYRCSCNESVAVLMTPLQLV